MEVIHAPPLPPGALTAEIDESTEMLGAAYQQWGQQLLWVHHLDSQSDRARLVVCWRRRGWGRWPLAAREFAIYILCVVERAFLPLLGVLDCAIVHDLGSGSNGGEGEDPLYCLRVFQFPKTQHDIVGLGDNLVTHSL